MKHFVKVDKELIGEAKVGEVFGLEVIEVGEQITLKLKKLQELSEENQAEEIKFSEVFAEGIGGLILKHNIKVNGVIFASGTFAPKDISLGGIIWQNYLNRNLSVVKNKDYWKFIGIY